MASAKLRGSLNVTANVSLRMPGGAFRLAALPRV
jgi:hypothetical protein